MCGSILFLGTAAAFGSLGRNLSSHLITCDGTRILLDAGPSVVSSLKKHSLTPADLDMIYLSHLHGDHILGLVFVALEFTYLTPPDKSLPLFLPEGGKEVLEQVMQIVYPGMSNKGWQKHFEFRIDTQWDFKGIKFTTFPADHDAHARLLLIETQQGKVGYTGDTGPNSEDLWNHVFKADTVITECTTFDQSIPQHLSFSEIIKKKDKIDAKRIYLVHTYEDVWEKEDQITRPFILPKDDTHWELFSPK